jgi:hypothetical protein
MTETTLATRIRRRRGELFAPIPRSLARHARVHEGDEVRVVLQGEKPSRS